jgi:predicted Rossmann-fold nucleotide-binding protein
MNQPELSKGYADSVSLNDEEGVARVLTESVLGLWDVVNNLTRLRPVQWRRFRVTIFGSARAEPGTLAYEHVKNLAQELAVMGCEVVTGGGPGLMQAANEGVAAVAQEDRQRSIGLRIQLDFEQHTNPFVGQAYEHRTFFSRLHHFVLLSHTFVVVPGGIGTTLEALMIWQLLQVRRLYGTPLIMIGRMWPEFVQWAKDHMLGVEPHLADPVDFAIPRCVADVDEALAIIREYHGQWIQDRASTEKPADRSTDAPPSGMP